MPSATAEKRIVRPAPSLAGQPDPSDLVSWAGKCGCTVADLTFVDVPGTLQHLSKPIRELRNMLDDGAGFDGSSIRGFRQIQESDMLLRPDPATAILDPFTAAPTLSMLCDVTDPVTGKLYDRSPRTIARQAMEYLRKSNIADRAYFGPEAEFFIFDHVSYESGAEGASYRIDSNEATWNSGMRNGTPNLGYTIRHKEGYFPAAPADTQQDIRAEMVAEMERAGISVEAFHHEVATAGQAEIDMVFDELLPMADKLMRYKYIVRNVARRHGKTVTFMPKPIFGDNGSGMHTHQSLWKDNRPLFAGNGYAGLSTMALHYMGGLLKHARALCALCNPTTNSYKRLVPGFEAPVNFIYSARNRSAAIRIPMYSGNPKTKRVEFRSPDPAANPYVAFAAMLMAGLDGVLHEYSPGTPTDRNLYEMSGEELSKIPHAPGDLGEALDALDADHAFLLEGDVFSGEYIRDFVTRKREEIADEAKRPTPSEFYRYFDI
ncbi:MAG: type I glutamate--ammonia ligase [Candidatus Peribacteraceae bacterium]|nr:type I glutamate--ammonia ligase [Candidatus Peribacteraceae bacterium]